MRTIHFNVPDDLDLKDFDLTMIVATELVGLSKRAFIELLGRYGVSVLSPSISDLHSDIANA